MPQHKGVAECRQEQFFTLYGNNAQNKKNSQSESRTNRKLVIQKPPVQVQDQPKQRNYIGIIQDLKGHTPSTAQTLFTPAGTAPKDKLSVHCQLAKFHVVPSRNQQTKLDSSLNPPERKLTFDNNSSRLAQTQTFPSEFPRKQHSGSGPGDQLITDFCVKLIKPLKQQIPVINESIYHPKSVWVAQDESSKLADPV